MRQMIMNIQDIYDGMGKWKNSKGENVDIYDCSFGVESFGSILESHRDGKCHVMQFTGLRDRNGKEIYEGDIVKHTFKFEHSEIGKIVWTTSARFVWLAVNETDGYGLQEKDGDFREVIGNIHENQELIKQEASNGKEKRQGETGIQTAGGEG